jgi:hypothetical protein
MDFGSKGIWFGVAAASVTALVVYFKDLIAKNGKLRNLVANLKNEKELKSEIDKIKEEVEDEEIGDLVDRANDRLRKRRDSE